MYIQKKLKKKKKKEREYNLNSYICVIVIFVIVPCICTSYTLVKIKQGCLLPFSAVPSYMGVANSNILYIFKLKQMSVLSFSFLKLITVRSKSNWKGAWILRKGQDPFFKGRGFYPVSLVHWTRCDHNTCPKMDTYHNRNKSNVT